MSFVTLIKAKQKDFKESGGTNMQSIDLKKIGNEIKVRRVKQGIQQTALAEMLDITQTHLSNIENGRVPGSLKLLLKLRSIFGCRLEDLVDPECDEAPVKANDKRMRRIKVIRYYENA